MNGQRVVLHYPTVYSAPVGVWWWNSVTNCPNSYYLPQDTKYHDLVMDQLGGAPNEQVWNEFTQKLVDRTPVSDSFEADYIHVSPQAYLKAHQPK